jgi:hypothetical protein
MFGRFGESGKNFVIASGEQTNQRRLSMKLACGVCEHDCKLVLLLPNKRACVGEQMHRRRGQQES